MLQRLRYPERLIRRRLDRRSVSLEIAVVLVCGLLGSIGTGYIAIETFDAIETHPPNLEYFLLAEVIRPVAVLFLVWIGFTVLGHVLANQRGGRGPIGRLARAAGWAVIPLGIWYLLRSIVLVALYAFVVDIPADPEGLGAAEQIDTVLALGFEHPAFLATLLVGLLFIAWSGYLLSVGVQLVKGLDRETSLRVAAVPAALYALYVLWTTLQFGGML